MDDVHYILVVTTPDGGDSWSCHEDWAEVNGAYEQAIENGVWTASICVPIRSTDYPVLPYRDSKIIDT